MIQCDNFQVSVKNHLFHPVLVHIELSAGSYAGLYGSYWGCNQRNMRPNRPLETPNRKVVVASTYTGVPGVHEAPRQWVLVVQGEPNATPKR